MRNETILKKALHEAMTEKYSEELINMKAPDYEFSESFNIKMRNLIRKTDNPFYRYSKYLTLAACGVIAVGCAVMITALNSNKINVDEKPGSTMAETTEAVISTVPTEAPVTVGEETAAPEDEIIGTEGDEVAGGEGNPDTETVTTAPDETEKAPVVTEATESSGDDEEEIGVTEYEPIGGTDNDDYDESDENPGAGSDGGGMDEIDEAVDSDGDYDVEDDDVDCDEDVCEDDEVIEDDNAEDTRPPYPEAKTLGELYTKLYQQDFNPDHVKDKSYKIENANVTGLLNNNISNSLAYADFSFVKEFLSEAAAAKKTELTSSSSDYVTVYLNPEAPGYYEPTFHDSSDVNRYREIYFGESTDEEDCEDEEIDYEYPDNVMMKIYRTGLIELSFRRNKDSVWFSATAEATGRFFENVDNLYLEEVPSVLGEIIADKNITAENICRGYANIREVYDYNITGINLNNSKSAIAEFLNNNKDKKLTYYKDYEESVMLITFGLKDTSSVISLSVIGFNKAVISVSGGEKYAFNIDKAQFISLLKVLTGACGYGEPVIYDTMADYIKDKGFDKLTEIEYTVKNDVYKLSEFKADGTDNTAVLEEIRQLILTEAKTAKYCLDGFNFGEIVPRVPNWFVRYRTFTISTEGAMYVGRNRFSVSKSFIEKLEKLLIEHSEVISNYYEEDDVEIDVEYVEEE